jgi:hypothetical protein
MARLQRVMHHPMYSPRCQTYGIRAVQLAPPYRSPHRTGPAASANAVAVRCPSSAADMMPRA